MFTQRKDIFGRMRITEISRFLPLLGGFSSHGRNYSKHPFFRKTNESVGINAGYWLLQTKVLFCYKTCCTCAIGFTASLQYKILHFFINLKHLGRVLLLKGLHFQSIVELSRKTISGFFISDSICL